MDDNDKTKEKYNNTNIKGGSDGINDYGSWYECDLNLSLPPGVLMSSQANHTRHREREGTELEGRGRLH